MKKRIIIIIALFFGLMFGTVMTYSFFNNDNSAVVDLEIAKFVFETKKTDHIDISLVDLKPGDSENYLFSVTNKDTGVKSDVTINYQVTISTYHFMPLDIKLYNINSGEELVLTCDETYSRDEDNNLVCNTPVEEIPYSSDGLDKYKLVVTFPSQYNGVEYADLVDYLSLNIKSWQKTA